MARKFISPTLADLTQDIAGPVPLEILQKWTGQKKSSQLHARILEAFKITGTVVSSDSAGLSKLSQSRTLMEVMKLVSYPKEVLYSYGSGIGGKAIGVWAADNTQMFYDPNISLHEVVTHMALVQKEIAGYELKIGMAIHSGTFFEIGGGLYGADADKVEELAESYSDGAEIVLTSEVVKTLDTGYSAFITKKENAPESFSLDYSFVKGEGKKNGTGHYPLPFSEEFFEDIRNGNLDEGKYSVNKIVILVKVANLKREMLLDELTSFVLANSVLTEIALRFNIQKVKSNGSLGIFLCDDPMLAIEFAKNVREALASEEQSVNIGVTCGSIMLFELSDGGLDIAGGPVNVASKLAEDSGEKNSILVEEGVKVSQENISGRFKYTISRVEIQGVRI